MSPDDIAALAPELGDGVGAEVSFGQVTLDVPVTSWVSTATTVRDDDRFAAGFFDWLSAYDDTAAGGEPQLAVVANVWSLRHRHALRLRTRVARDGGSLPTLTGVWAGADWHERETFEMFGVLVEGHPNLVPLLLPDGFEGHPLRKDFVLASRVAKAWPGVKEPGESDADVAAPAAEPGEGARRPRRRVAPPGVPEPGSWGPAS